MGLPSFCRDKCRDYKTCRKVCDYIDRIADGNKPLREYLAGLDMERYPNQDYKQALIEHQDARRLTISYTISDIRNIPDSHQRLIAAALYADIPVRLIAKSLKISKQRVYQQIQSHLTIKTHLTPQNN